MDTVHVITARVRSTREGTVFTGVCLSTSRGGRYLPSVWWGVPTQLWTGGGGGGSYSALDGVVPTQLWTGRGGYLLRSGRGVVSTFPGLDGGVTYLLGEGVPTLG